ncbi:class I SAM-dependent methyltransferase [Candidatus Pelagibacter sp. HIMB1483]|uniref:class I SAM-dependent methyltransferase n=1 Tax=Candidatus Pelagibacter sp. HIMB1483 TaxID=3415414 RepID=UPI003F831119
MRNWYKYTLEDNNNENFSSVLEYTSHQIKKDFSDLDKLFEFDFFNKDFSKYIYEYLSEKLYGSNLSIGSGWGHLEYHLSKKFNITASDINEEYSKYNKKINYIITDIISKDFQTNSKYDNVFAPGIIYLFNEKELNIFFKNIQKTMIDNGNFYLFFRSNDSVFINFLDNCILPFENLIKYSLKITNNKKIKIQKNHHGFRRYPKELEKVIYNNGFTIVSKKKLMFQAEYNRSKILRVIGFSKIVPLLKLHPYITVYHLKKLL